MESEKLYFFTATVLEWKPLLLRDSLKNIITSSLEFLVTKKRIKLCGFVIMPNHFHLLWSILESHRPENVQRDFLKFTSQQIIEQLKRNGENQWIRKLEVNAIDRKYQIWERNPLAVETYTEAVILQKLQYIHNNPTQQKWRLCVAPEDYVYSSARFYYFGDSKWPFLTHFRD